MRDDGNLGHSDGSGGGEKWSNSDYILKDLLMNWIRGIRKHGALQSGKHTIT